MRKWGHSSHPHIYRILLLEGSFVRVHLSKGCYPTEAFEYIISKQAIDLIMIRTIQYDSPKLRSVIDGHNRERISTMRFGQGSGPD
jgi:hypothetical protein